MIAYWTNVDSDIGARVAAGLGRSNGSGDGVAAPADAATTGGGAR